MKAPTFRPRLLLAAGLLGTLLTVAGAHPSAGIVVDADGRVYFDDLSRGLMRVNLDGTVTTLSAEGGHWLALDETGSFSRVDFSRSPHWPRWFKRKTPPGVIPALLIDGGSPLTVGPDGSLYFVCDDERLIPAGLQIGRLTPDGRESLVCPGLLPLSKKLGGIKGLTAGPDGTLYVSFPRAVYKVSPDGHFLPLADPILAPDCAPNVALSDTPFLRGIAVDDRGVWIAASGCGSVLILTSDGQVTVALRSEQPWVPAGVFLRDGTLYVLEHRNGNSTQHEEWPPRLRKMESTGRITTLVDLSDAPAP